VAEKRVVAVSSLITVLLSSISSSMLLKKAAVLWPYPDPIREAHQLATTV